MFSIGLDIRDLQMLEKIKKFFVVGNINISIGMAYYRVTFKKDLNNVIIPHFLKYGLITQKKFGFQLI